MKRLFLMVVAAVVLSTGATARSEEALKVDLQSLLSVITYNYDSDNFLGDLSMNFYGVGGGEITFAITDSAGNKVFEQAYPCSETYASDGSPACFTDSQSVKDKIKPSQMKSGAYTLSISYSGKKFYELKYDVSVVEQYGLKSVYIGGDWAAMASLQLSAQPAVRVNAYGGGPGKCGMDGADVQVQLFRDGVYIAKGHMEGLFYESCSTYGVSFGLFYEDEKHLTKWLGEGDITGKDGKYELVLLKNGEPSKTYAFEVTAGKVVSAPKGVQPGLFPDKLKSYSPDPWIYLK